MAHKSHNKAQRQQVAKENKEARALRTDLQQIEVLKGRPGNSVREIAKLNKKNGGA